MRTLCVLLLACAPSFCADLELFNHRSLDGWELIGDGIWHVLSDGTLIGERDLRPVLRDAPSGQTPGLPAGASAQTPGLPAGSSAEAGIVAGRVVDARTGAGIEKVFVLIEDGGPSTQTDSTGASTAASS